VTKRYIQSTLVTLVALLLSCGGALEAQTITGALNGTVTDPTGAVIPNAKVTATNVDTGIETPSTTNTEGIYNIPFLQIGNYKLSVDVPGFATANYGPFVLETAQIAKVDVKMGLSSAQQKVSVEAELVPLLNTENPTLATTLDTRAIENAPLVGRNIIALTMFLPGAVSTNPNGFVGNAAVSGPQTPGSSQTVSVNGNRQQTNQYLLDGMPVDENLNNISAYNPSPDAIGQIRVISANAPASTATSSAAISSTRPRAHQPVAWQRLLLPHQLQPQCKYLVQQPPGRSDRKELIHA
jgi:hypothetical protein